MSLGMLWHDISRRFIIIIIIINSAFFLVLAHLGSPGQRAVKRVCVCVCVIVPSIVSSSTLKIMNVCYS